jgi:hypothetical protein
MIHSQRAMKFLAVAICCLVVVACIQRKPERTVKKESPVTGELASIVEEDSALRVNLDIPDTARARVSRRNRDVVYRLLAQALIVEPEDLYRAALVLQHSEQPAARECCLLAHKLALEAVEKGYPRARFLAAAALDRYLLLNDRPQKYGTQYTRNRAGQYVILPYDTQTPDSVRAAWDVPSLDSLQVELKSIKAPKKKTSQYKTKH